MLLALTLIGVVLLVVGYNVPAQPVPLNQLEIIGGWIAIVAAIILLVLYLVRGGRAGGHPRYWRF